jgi:exo-1,4-beta-D-glucosaminidase
MADRRGNRCMVARGWKSATEVGQLLSVAVLAASLTLVSCARLGRGAHEHTIGLEKGWRIQSSSLCAKPAEAIATAGFDTAGWHATTAPSTVLAALVRDGTYTDPFFGLNLEGIGAAQFKQPWWYRTEFTLDRGTAARHVQLVLDGVNYSADVWLNGRRIATRSDVLGAFRTFDLDLTGRVVKGVNALAIEVFPPQPGDFTIGFVDWNPEPPDHNMGIWRPVKLRVSGPVALDEVFVRPLLDPSLEHASLSISALLINNEAHEVRTSLNGSVGQMRFSKEFTLAPKETQRITLSTADLPQLRLDHPKLWWPNHLGKPNLYRLELDAFAGGRLSDRQQVTFGVRSVSDYVNEQGYRGYKINGKPVLIKGGGWADDLFLREDPARLEAQFAYARHMNLNTIRLEGIWGSSQRLYDLADRYGIMLMVGWSCQWEWKEYLGKDVDENFGGVQTPEDMELITRSLRNQVTWLRNHPSIFVWVVGSDKLPKPELEEKYRAMLAVVDPTRPVLAACSTRTSEVSGPTGVKMNGPYDYVTPNYWYEDTEHGGAFGFNTETGPGPQPPPLESLERMFPSDHLWPIDAVWNFHCARHEFKDLHRYLNALVHRYGRPTGVEDFARKAQLANYEAVRAMFEAFIVRRPVTTGIIQWMYNAAWPKLYWQLYDYYLMPNGAYFGTRTACRPLNLIYDYGSNAVWAVNDGLRGVDDVTAEIRVFNMDSKQKFSTSKTLDVRAGTSVKVADLPAIKGLTPVYFLDLRLKERDGAPRPPSFYWLSTKKDVLDPKGSEWFVTPNKAYADFTALAQLPESEVEVTQQLIESADGRRKIHFSLLNPSPVIAFFLELKLVGAKSGKTMLPVLWDDNYISLLPGERRGLTATVETSATGGELPVVRCSGYNVKPQWEPREKGATPP